VELPEFSVTVTPYEREGSNIRGLARVYFDDSFIVNNVSILQGKDKLFVAMPSYKTKQTDEQGKAVYQDVCYPVTKEFREKLYAEIVNQYEIAKVKKEEQALGPAQTQAQSQDKTGFKEIKQETPFR
jgi:DNA-binding cell septation regulator SpoVG